MEVLDAQKDTAKLIEESGEGFEFVAVSLGQDPEVLVMEEVGRNHGYEEGYQRVLPFRAWLGKIAAHCHVEVQDDYASELETILAQEIMSMSGDVVHG